jgi:hypothetical protein
LYIFKNIHNINNLSYDGELIIEHIPVTNNVDKLFTVFMLKTDNIFQSPGILDNLIANAGIKNELINLNLNEIIETNNTKKWYFPGISNSLNCMNNENVYVFSTPILVNSSFEYFKNVKKGEVDFLFSENLKYDLNITAIPHNQSNLIIEALTDGASGNMVIKCTPIHTNEVDENVSFLPITKESKKGYELFTSLFVLILILIISIYPFYHINTILKQRFSQTEYYIFISILTVINIIISFILFNDNSSINNIIGLIFTSVTVLIIIFVFIFQTIDLSDFNNSVFNYSENILGSPVIFGFIFLFLIILVIITILYFYVYKIENLFLYFFPGIVFNFCFIVLIILGYKAYKTQPPTS